MPTDDILALIDTFAAANGILLALILVLRGSRDRLRSRLTLGGFLFLVSVLLGLFVLLDRSLLVISPALAVGLDLAAIAMSGLMLDYVLTMIGQRRGRVWAYAPVALYAVVAVVTQGPIGASTDFLGVVTFQVVMTSLAAGLYLKRWFVEAPNWRRKTNIRRLRFFFLAMALTHAAQLARLALPSSALLYDAVPLFGALALALFVVFTLADSRALGDLVKAPVQDQPDDAFEARLVAAVVETRLYIDPGFGLAGAASAVNVEPRELSTYLNTRKNMSVRDYIKRLRIEEAQRMLGSAEDARTSIEAIGLLCGFKSRSSFYEAFKDITDMSPNAWRDSVSSD